MTLAPGRRFRLWHKPGMRFVAARVGPWRLSLVLSLFWPRPAGLWLWWDGSAGNCPILRVGPVVIAYWKSHASTRQLTPANRNSVAWAAAPCAADAAERAARAA